MACTEDEFLELLSDESSVDIIGLKEVSKYGIPDKVRGEVWKYLLGVYHPDKGMVAVLINHKNYLENAHTFSSA